MENGHKTRTGVVATQIAKLKSWQDVFSPYYFLLSCAYFTYLLPGER